MFKLNLKIAWRNLIKYRGYTAVNILGLAIGLIGFILIILLINHEKSYDTWNPELANVYQVQEHTDFNATDKKAHWISDTDMRLSRVFTESIPEVKAVTMVNIEYKELGITIPGKPSFLQSGIRRSDSLFFQVMPYQFKYGSSATAFAKPNSIVLKESLALKYFGNINPVGKTVTIAGGAWRGSEDDFTVTGVIEEPQTPSILNFEAIYFWRTSFFDVTGDHADPAEIYVKTWGHQEIDYLNEKIQKAYLPLKESFLKARQSSVKLATSAGKAPILKVTKLSDVHQNPLKGESWKSEIKPVLLLSILLLLVAIINFINLSTAQAVTRAKEVGIKKVVGAFKPSLIIQFFAETFIQCLLALFIALLAIEISIPTINNFLNLDLTLFNNPATFSLLLQLLGIVFLVTLLTGLYPSIFLSRYKPSEVLKGNFANGKSGSTVRKILVAVQFVVAISLMIGILLINNQLKYLKERDHGFTSTGLMNVRTFISPVGYSSADYHRLKKIDGVKRIAYSSAVIGDNWTITQDFKYKDQSVKMFGTAIGIEGMQALDARLLKGRFFSPNMVSDTINNVMLNESAAKLFKRNMIGEHIATTDSTQVSVIGIIKDIQVEGFENAAKPAVYLIENDQAYKRTGIGFTMKPTTLIRFEKSKVGNLIAELEKINAEKNKFYPLKFTFVEEDFAATLSNHERFEKMVAAFSMLSLTLSLFGLFSLAALITKQRTKEIAIRKVLGAENTNILLLLNSGYIWIVLLANVVAFPLAYLLIKKWLATFAYQMELTPFPFLIAFISSITITVLTVSLQARRAINSNPVNALKYE